MKTLLNTVIGMVVTASVVNAQSHKEMDHGAMGDMATTYIGCVETVNHGAAFVLTHISDDGMAAMHGTMSMKDAPMTPMKDDAMMKTDDTMMKADGAMNHTAPALLLTGGLNMRKHVGQRVRVTGVVGKNSGSGVTRDLDTLKATALKIVAKSCQLK